MSTHCNFAAIIPNHDGTFQVCIVRGVIASGDNRVVAFETIADGLALQEAATVAAAAPKINKLRFADYAPLSPEGR